jgi:hypothetical protein
MIELPAIQELGADLSTTSAAEIDKRAELWGEIGVQMFHLEDRVAERVDLFDPRSERLVRAQLGTREGAARSESEITETLDALAQSVVADTAQNETLLRVEILRELGGMRRDLQTVNAFVYATVFSTPAQDPWLGLLPTTFTGLPADGVRVARP